MIEWVEDDEYLEKTRDRNKIRLFGRRRDASEEIRKDCKSCLVIEELTYNSEE